MGEVIPFPYVPKKAAPATLKPKPVGRIEIRVMLSLTQDTPKGKRRVKTRYVIHAREMVDSHMVKEVEAVGLRELRRKLTEILDAARARWLSPQPYYPNDRRELNFIQKMCATASL